MVYEFLNERAAQNQVYLASLFENNYIFINGHFMKGSLCALQSQLCFPPYVSGLPNDLAAHYKDLWSAMKIRKQFDVKSYMQIIETIFSEYGQQPLSKEVLDMVLKIINECTSVEDESQQDGNIQVYLPDHRNILRPVSELYFNDTCWLSKDPTDGTPLCHPRIAPHDAKKLGVASWRQKTLQLHKKQLPGQKFGQKVKLVNRLKRILEGYPLDEGILKELVQNADDAGATKIHFIKDSRILPNKRIFDEKWEPLQRCSLSVYNDKPFSKEDLEGIQCLGEGSKSKERTKIGKYGIGFNCIYNLTDVPTFLTNVDGVGRVLCVMDPTLQYVEGSSEDSPGFMFDKIQTLSKTFPDVFSGYLEEHYGVSGTVFRFPLRMKESPISNRIVTEKILDELFENMKEEIESCLIFLKNVREIVLMDMGPEGKIQSLFRVTATLKEADQKQLDEFQINCKITSSELDEGHNLNSVKEEVRYVMETKDSDNIQQEWLIVQRLGFTDNSFLNENHRTYVRETQDFSLLPLAGVAYPIKQKVKSNQMKLFCFLPLPKTINLPVHVNGHFALDSENRRSLWEHTRPDYRSEWNDRLLSDVAAEAYCSLILAINDLVNREISNSRSLELTETVLSKFEYGTVFPDCRDSNERCIHLLVKSVYEILWRQNSPILPVYSLAAGSPDLNIVWMGSRGTDQIKPCFDLLETELEKFFAAPTHGNQDQNKRAEKELREVLISFGFPLVHSSCNFHYNFHGCGISVQCSNPDYILQFFADFKKTCGQLDLPCYLQETPFQCVLSFKTVLMFCSHAEGFKDFVRQTPFLLTQDEVLRQFENSALPFYIDRYTVAPHALQKFAHAEIRDILRSANMTQEFTVAGFISILPPLLPENIFHRSDKIVAFETFAAYLQNYSYMKSPEKLLQDIWKFLESRIKPSDYEILKEWCLLPVTTNGCDRLLPLTKAGTVIIGSQVEESFDPNLRDSLSEIGMSMLNETYVSPITLAKFPNCKIHLSVAIIQYLITCKEHSFVLGKHSDCLLKFLSHHIEHWKYVQGAAGAVKCLPIFKYFDGRTGNLMQSECYIVPETVPNEEAIKWTAENSALFLASKFEISGLLQWIQCKHIKEDCLYSQFIFKKFHKLSPDGRLQHLMFVKDHLMKHVPRSQILCNSLKNLKFLSSSDSSSELRTASTFYDWNVEIFKIMQPPSDFPSQPFRNYEWLEFLKLCDLISKVTEEHLLRYANEVSKKTARGDFDEPVCKKAKLLVTNVMELDDLSTRFSNALKTMPIVQAVVVPKQLSMLHPQKIIENGSFVGFKSSLESRHTDYAWTTSDLLPTWATRKRKLLEKLEVCDKPSGATVAQHLFNLCSSFVNKPQGTEAKEIFCRIVKKIYKLLSDKEISKEDVGCLNNSRCIIINAENELAMADQVVINLPEENVIEPYLYSLPSELYEYVNFFLKIQVEKELQIEHYIRVLGRVFQKVGKTEPIPNDRRIVLKAFAGLLNQLRGRKEVADLKELILPSENGKLYNSSELVIKDDISLANRICRFEGIKFLIDLNELKDFGLNDADYKIFEKLAPHLRPPLLSDVVLQKMETASELNEEICSKSNKIWKTISAPQFSDGIKCLLTSKADLIGAVIEDKLKNLSKLQVYDVPSIVTYLEYQQKRIPGSELDSNFHITDIGADLIKVYISEKLHDIKDSQMLTTKLACLVNELLDGALLPVLVNVPPLFLCKPDEIVSTLCELGFQSVGSSKSARATPYLPKLGQFVPITMHHMLQQGFSSFKRGDLVALEYGDDLEDSVYIMVEIIEAISSGTSSSLNANYRVKTGDDTEQIVNCSVLYEFCSPLSFDEDGALIPSQTTDAQDSTPVHDEIPQLKDIIRDIKRTLIESRTLSEDQRRRVIKRLYLRWHPDKNSTELSDLCTKIVQILQKLIENINNLSSEEDDDEGTDFPDGQFHTSQHTRYRSSQSSSRGSDHDRSHGSASGGTFNFNFNFWDETARGHKKQYEEYRNQKSSYGHSAFQNRDFSFRQPNPQPQEARRWMRQGEYDLESAEHDRTKQFFEWSCYKYHQAAEKALKAIQFNIDANQQFTHSLSSLCSGIVDKSVLESIRKLEQIIPNPAAMRYPNSHNYPKVPHDVYSAETTAEVASLASEIVQFAKRIIRERNT